MNGKATFTCKYCNERIVVKSNSLFGLIKNSYKTAKSHKKECPQCSKKN